MVVVENVGGERRLEIEATEQTEEKLAVKDKNDSESPHQPSDEHLVDMELVGKVRELLEAEWNNGNKKEEYSEIHYQELMDPKCACTCWRYLEHCDFKIGDTMEQIRSSLIWRKQNKVDEPADKRLVKEFWFHAPIFFCGRDKSGLDVVYVIGKNYRKPNAKIAPIIKLFLQNMLFKWDRQNRYNLKKFIMVFDVSEVGVRNMDLEMMSWFVSLRDHLPARISRAYVFGVPLLMRPLVKLIISWLPVKFTKFVHCGSFDQVVKANIDLDQLPRELGGTKPEALYRLAPKEAVWASESSFLAEENMQKYVHEAVWFSVTNEMKQKLRAFQEDYENNRTLKN